MGRVLNSPEGVICVQTSEEECCELEPLVTINTSDICSGLSDLELFSLSFFHCCFVRKRVGNGQISLAERSFQCMLPVAYNLHTLFIPVALHVELTAGGRREPGWTVLQQFPPDAGLWQSSWYRLEQLLQSFHLWKGWAGRELASG